MSIGYQNGSEPRTRTYGGWRRSRGIGILGAGLGGSSFLIAAWTLLAVLGAAVVDDDIGGSAERDRGDGEPRDDEEDRAGDHRHAPSCPTGNAH